MDKKVELLKKLKALADRGIDGEKVAAEKMLNKLMQKHGISEAELSEDEVETMVFEYHGEEQKKLLVQIIYKVTNKTDIFYDYINPRSKNRSYTKFGADVTSSQKIEIEFLFDFYKRQYEKEREFFLEAFIQKHCLFGNSQPDNETPTISADKIRKISSLMNGMDVAHPLRQIEAAKNS